MNVGLGAYGLSFAAGGLSTLSPCVLPLLPILLGQTIRLIHTQLAAPALHYDYVLGARKPTNKADHLPTADRDFPLEGTQPLYIEIPKDHKSDQGWIPVPF